MATLLPRFAALFEPLCLFERWEDLADLMGAAESRIGREQVGPVVMGEAPASPEMIGLVAAAVTARCQSIRRFSTIHQTVGLYVAAFSGVGPTPPNGDTDTPTFDTAIRLLPAIGANELGLLWQILGVVKYHGKTPTSTEMQRFVEVVQATRATGNHYPNNDLLRELLEGICPTDD